MDPETFSSNSKPPKSPKKTLLIIGAVISVVIIAAISAVALKFTVFSRSHDNTQPSFVVESASFQIIDLSDSELSAMFDFNLSVHNPGVNDRIAYQSMGLEVSYKEQPLASNTVSSFPDGGGEVWSPMEVKLSANGVQFDEAQDLASDVANGSAIFNARLYAGYWIDGESGNRAWSALEETCYSLEIGFSSDQKTGKLLNGPIQCVITKTWD